MTVVAAIAVLFAVAGAAVWWSYRNPPARSLTIASGPEGGTYRELADRIETIFAQNPSIARDVAVATTHGSGENAHLIEAGDADLALVQADTPLPSRARLISPLYEEVLHILASTGDGAEVLPLEWLEGKRIFLGEPESGTRRLARAVLDLFDIDVEEQALTQEAAIAAFRERNGRLDALFLLSAYPSATVEHLIGGGATLVTIGDPEDTLNAAYAFPAPCSCGSASSGRKRTASTATICGSKPCSHTTKTRMRKDSPRSAVRSTNCAPGPSATSSQNESSPTTPSSSSKTSSTAKFVPSNTASGC